MHLIIGSKEFSTWSLRPWILMKELGIEFKETVIELNQSNTSVEIAKFTESGRVPCLQDIGVLVWDSLAIVEYLAEKYPGVWPQDPAQRAWARSVVAEMHSGFQALRKNLPGMFLKSGLSYPKDNKEVQSDIARMKSIWLDGLSRWGGAFLCGPKFNAVDAFFAPVALGRFLPYGVELEPQLKAYCEMLSQLKSSKSWIKEASTMLAA